MYLGGGDKEFVFIGFSREDDKQMEKQINPNTTYLLKFGITSLIENDMLKIKYPDTIECVKLQEDFTPIENNTVMNKHNTILFFKIVKEQLYGIFKVTYDEYNNNSYNTFESNTFYTDNDNYIYVPLVLKGGKPKKIENNYSEDYAPYYNPSSNFICKLQNGTYAQHSYEIERNIRGHYDIREFFTKKTNVIDYRKLVKGKKYNVGERTGSDLGSDLTTRVDFTNLPMAYVGEYVENTYDLNYAIFKCDGKDINIELNDRTAFREIDSNAAYSRKCDYGKSKSSSSEQEYDLATQDITEIMANPKQTYIKIKVIKELEKLPIGEYEAYIYSEASGDMGKGYRRLMIDSKRDKTYGYRVYIKNNTTTIPTDVKPTDFENNFELIEVYPVESEVFRLTPEKDKCYEHAEYTRKQGTWSEKNERYFTSIPPRYVGKHLRHESYGTGDGREDLDIFIDENGKENRVDYTYEGRTSFREVPCHKS